VARTGAAKIKIVLKRGRRVRLRRGYRLWFEDIAKPEWYFLLCFLTVLTKKLRGGWGSIWMWMRCVRESERERDSACVGCFVAAEK
jgi:hypothetical protein